MNKNKVGRTSRAAALVASDEHARRQVILKAHCDVSALNK
jgi:hypothetical protein